MCRIPSLISVLLIASVTITSSWRQECFCSDGSDRSPKGEPVKESEETAESEKSEQEDGDDFEAFAVVLVEKGGSARTLGMLRNVDACLSRMIIQCRADHCRAPPALLI